MNGRPDPVGRDLFQLRNVASGILIALRELGLCHTKLLADLRGIIGAKLAKSSKPTVAMLAKHRSDY